MSANPEFWKTVRWLGVLGTIVALVWFGLRLVDRGAAGALTGLQKALGMITQSDTRIVEGRAVISETSEISELALIDMRMSATRSFEQETHLMRLVSAGTKRLVVQGEYRVTAGYKLKPGVSLSIENDVPVARFPEPEILGVELLHLHQLDEKDGWANELTGADREQVVRDLSNQMRQEARRSGVLDTVESQLKTRLSDLLGVGEVKIERTEKERKPVLAKGS